jgi:hypothetical protein
MNEGDIGVIGVKLEEKVSMNINSLSINNETDKKRRNSN